MALRFKSNEIPERDRGLTFDDVLIVPSKSEVKSRRDPDLAARLTKKSKLQIPLISANMDTITESEMAIAMGELGGLGILHRFMSVSEQAKQARLVAERGFPLIGASIHPISRTHPRLRGVFRQLPASLTSPPWHTLCTL